MSNILEQLNEGVSSAVEGAQRSLVQISVGPGNGAGTIWHSDGLIITNAHVVSAFDRPRRGGWSYSPYGRFSPRETSLAVTLPDGRRLPARILAQDIEHDIAALTVEASGLPTIELGDSRHLRAGQMVFAVGHPWGVLGAASAGIVVGAGSEFPEMPAGGKEWIVISLKVRPGNSGGPLLDVYGRLIGVNTLMTGPQVGAAIPIHTVKSFLKEALGSPVAASITATPETA